MDWIKSIPFWKRHGFNPDDNGVVGYVPEPPAAEDSPRKRMIDKHITEYHPYGVTIGHILQHLGWGRGGKWGERNKGEIPRDYFKAVLRNGSGNALTMMTITVTDTESSDGDDWEVRLYTEEQSAVPPTLREIDIHNHEVKYRLEKAKETNDD